MRASDSDACDAGARAWAAAMVFSRVAFIAQAAWARRRRGGGWCGRARAALAAGESGRLAMWGIRIARFCWVALPPRHHVSVTCPGQYRLLSIEQVIPRVAAEFE